RAGAAPAGAARATVTWLAPYSHKNSAPPSYTVAASPGGIGVTVSAASLTATVGGLANGTTYTFTVVAANSAGSGPASAPSNPVTPKPAGADTTPPPDTTTPPDTTAPPAPPSGTGRWVSGYYVGYQRSLQPPSEIDFSSLTHVIMGRVRPRSDGTLYTDFDIDNVNGPAVAREVSTRAHAAGRKAILMVGGAGERAGFVAAASSATRPTFVTSLLRAMDDYGYDGLDVDWEPLESTDQPLVIALVQALRAARPGVLITFPVGWANTNFPSWTSSWFAQLAPLVDQLNIMTYDMAGPWSGWTSWHNSALAGHASSHPSSVAGSVQVYRGLGISASKLGVGMAFYGQCWRGVTGPNQSIGSSSLVASDNVMSYVNIMASYHSAGAARWDDVAQVPYLSFGSATGPQGCTYVTYDDARSVAAKGDFVRAQGLGGAIVWTISQGYQASAPLGQRNPLLAAAYAAIAP
ncbi:MAG: glycosyl hydrolase family 18 protein, partial [Gemmatimonadaceae bacterium]